MFSQMMPKVADALVLICESATVQLPSFPQVVFAMSLGRSPWHFNHGETDVSFEGKDETSSSRG